MPPKKKKGSKKSGKKESSNKNANDVPEEDLPIDEPVLNKEFYLLHIKDLERKLRLYKEKSAKYQTINDEYMKKQKDLSQEKHDLISFLEKNLLNRGDEFSDLKDRYFGLQQAKEAEKNQFEMTLQEIRSKLQESKDQLTADNSLLSAKLAALEEFKLQKEKYLEEYSQLEQLLAVKKQDHQMILDSIEEKCSHDHDRLKKEIVTRINMVAAEFRRISQKQTSETTKRTIRENVSIRTQLGKMDDKNIEMMNDNEQLRQKSKISATRIKELDRICTELATNNLSQTKLLHLLLVKYKEHQEIISAYQEETNIIQQIDEKNETMKLELEKNKTEIEEMENTNEVLRKDTLFFNEELKEIDDKTEQARRALIDAVHHLQELLQFVPTTTAPGSAKSSYTSMSKSSLSQSRTPLRARSDFKEWGDVQQKGIVEEKLQQLLNALDYPSSSRASSVTEISTKSKISIRNELRGSPSISIATRNVSEIRRRSPSFKEDPNMKSKSQPKILTEYEIKTQAKLHALQQKKGFCVPGLLQLVPHMSKHIPTNREKTQQLNRKLNGLNTYVNEEEIEKPLKSNLLKSVDENRIKTWGNKLTT